MNIRVVAVGKLKERYWADACAEYLKRLRPYAKVEITEIPDVDPAKAGGVGCSLEKEAAGILTSIPVRSQAILLAIDGTPRSSEGFASRLEESALSGRSDITFIIGGSDGVAQSVRDRCEETLSFGPITLPHNLARVVLLEQLYRAFKISRNEPYHK